MIKVMRAAFAAAILSCALSTSAFAFGAIAVDDEQGMAADEAGWGVGWGSSRSEAERNAMKECRSAGNESCKVAVWFEQCGAYVGDRVNFAIGYGSTKKAAESMAFKDCPNCKLVVSDCQ
jgi:dsRNA-specific ribonuclease